MSGTEPQVEITPASRLKVPNRTAIAEYEDDIVVSGVTGTKTLSGETARLAGEILAASDGETPLREVVPSVGDEATTLAIAEALYTDGLLYPAELLAAFDVDDRRQSLLESLLLGLDPDRRPGFADSVGNLAVRLDGDPTVAAALGDSLAAVGCTVDAADPDVLVFAEADASADREAVNREWLDSDATLVRGAIRGTEVEIGPVLSSSSTGCLDCLTTREGLNDAGRTLSYRTVAPAPSYEVGFCSHVLTRLVLQAGLDCLPPELVGRLFRFDLRTLDHDEARLLGVPGCDACDDRY